MKRFFSILFLFVFLLNIAGYYPLFLIKQAQIRGELKRLQLNKTPKDKLTYLVIAANETETLRWVKMDEFIYNGNLYDVVYQKHDQKGNIHYWCINDTKEKDLVSHFEKEVNKNTNTSGPDQNSKNPLTKNPLKDLFHSGKLITSPINGTEVIFFVRNANIASQDIEITTPPPKLSRS